MYLAPRAAASNDGPVPQFEITGKAAVIVAISFVETILALTGIILRLYAARTGASRLRWDFWFVVGATALGITTEGLFVMACKYGVGEHIHAVSFDQLWIALKFSWIGIYTGLMGTLVGKSAIGAMLYQVATPQQWKRKAFLFTACAFNFATGCTQLVLSIVQCTPHEKLWYQLTPGKCDREDIAFKFGYLQGSVAILTDFMLALYPITIVWNLQASMRTKVGFCVLMAGGMICAIAAIMRTYYTAILRTPTDPTYQLVTFLAWASTELWFVIIIASIPPLRPLFLRWGRTTKSLVSKSRSKSGHDGSVPLESVSTGVPRITINIDGSQEEILCPRNSFEHIMVTREYAVDVAKKTRVDSKAFT